jgi:hypothetical protein
LIFVLSNKRQNRSRFANFYCLIAIDRPKNRLTGCIGWAQSNNDVFESMRDRHKKLKECVFCGKGKEAGPMSKEHVVPKGLWDRKPSDLVTVPAHVKCNEKHSRDNEYFRLVIANVCHDLGSKRAVELTQGPISRSMISRTKQFLGMTKDFAERPRFSPSGIYLGHQASFSIDYSIIARVLQNSVRCLFYDLTGKRLPADSNIQVSDCDGDDYVESTAYFVDRMCPWLSIGGDVFSVRYGFKEGFEDICCLMRFYGVKTFFAASMPGDK